MINGDDGFGMECSSGGDLARDIATLGTSHASGLLSEGAEVGLEPPRDGQRAARSGRPNAGSLPKDWAALLPVCGNKRRPRCICDSPLLCATHHAQRREPAAGAAACWRLGVLQRLPPPEDLRVELALAVAEVGRTRIGGVRGVRRICIGDGYWVSAPIDCDLGSKWRGDCWPWMTLPGVLELGRHVPRCLLSSGGFLWVCLRCVPRICFSTQESFQRCSCLLMNTSLPRGS